MKDEQHIANTDSSADKRILMKLRQQIMDGGIKVGEKLSEVAVAKQYNVSRTPARMALSALEVEGLIKKREGRGFVVVEMDFGDMRDAYEVRGVLEGLAAGALAKRGAPHEVQKTLRQSILNMDEALRSNASEADKVAGYQKNNAVFHQTIIEACGNSYISFTLDRLGRLPLLKPGTVVFNEDQSDRDFLSLQLGNMQHRLIFDAIAKRDPQRAEAMMREHANQTLVYSALFTVEKDLG